MGSLGTVVLQLGEADGLWDLGLVLYRRTK